LAGIQAFEVDFDGRLTTVMGFVQVGRFHAPFGKVRDFYSARRTLPAVLVCERHYTRRSNCQEQFGQLFCLYLARIYGGLKEEFQVGPNSE